MTDRDWRTLRDERRVLVVARTVTALTRLADILALTAPDHRIQTYFTHDPAHPAVFGAGVERLLDRLDPVVVPWREARRDRFHLALSVSENDRLHQLRSPVLLMPHGVGYQKYYPDSQVVSGLNPARLVRAGRVIPATIGVPHPAQREQLRAACPEAAPRAAVVGDPSLDRMLDNQHRDLVYRAALGAAGRKLVLLASTFGPHSLFGRWPDLPELLVARLPADEYRIVIVMHTGVWAKHGPWQVRGWLSRAGAYGLRILPPESGWQAALVAATCVLSDEGSLSLYAAALDKPLLLAPGGGSPTTVPGSALAWLGATAPRLDPGRDLRRQIDATIDRHDPGVADTARAATFDAPGRCATRLRPLIYRLIDLPEPSGEPAFAPIPAPDATAERVPAHVVGASTSDDDVTVVRYPDLPTGDAPDDLDHRHLVADIATATAAQVGAATIIVTDREADAPELLTRWPAALLVAVAPDPHTCRIHTRTLTGTLRLTGLASDVDPVVLASLAHVRLRSGGTLSPRDQLRVGDRVIPVWTEVD
ncbi:hypothetical protein WEI85_40525 [Actinomycetes bacterium KLBMP 9797]